MSGKSTPSIIESSGSDEDWLDFDMDWDLQSDMWNLNYHGNDLEIGVELGWHRPNTEKPEPFSTSKVPYGPHRWYAGYSGCPTTQLRSGRNYNEVQEDSNVTDDEDSIAPFEDEEVNCEVVIPDIEVIDLTKDEEEAKKEVQVIDLTGVKTLRLGQWTDQLQQGFLVELCQDWLGLKDLVLLYATQSSPPYVLENTLSRKIDLSGIKFDFENKMERWKRSFGLGDLISMNPWRFGQFDHAVELAQNYVRFVRFCKRILLQDDYTYYKYMVTLQLVELKY